MEDGLEEVEEVEEVVAEVVAVPEAGEEEEEGAAAAALSSARLRCLSSRVCSDSLRSGYRDQNRDCCQL